MEVTKNFTILASSILISLTSLSCCTFPKLENNSASIQKKTEAIFFVKRRTQANVRYSGDSEGVNFEGEAGGTGVLISKKFGKSFIITANHVCYDKISQIKKSIPLAETATISINFTRIFVYDNNGDQHSAIPLISDAENDVCVLLAETMDVQPIRLANTKPNIGDRIVSLSLPVSIWSPRFIPIFDGFYVGKAKISTVRNFVYGFSTPSKPGSSGGAVVNSNGRLVGMIHTVRANFSHLAFCATEDQIRKDLLRAYEEYKKEKENLELMLLII